MIAGQNRIEEGAVAEIGPRARSVIG